MNLRTALTTLTLLTAIWADAVTRIDMETIRLDPAIATTQNKILVAGGNPEYSGPTALVSVYSISARQFVTPANLTKPRLNLVGLSFANTVLFIDTDTAEGERYDPATNTFSTFTINGLATPFVAAVVNNKAVFVTRGHTGLVYNVDTKTVRSFSLCTSNCEERNEGIATAVAGSRAFFAGGGVAGSRRVDIYNDATGAFTSNALTLSVARSYLKSAVTSNQVVFAGGPLLYPNADGSSGSNCTKQSVLDVYNLQSGVWTSSRLPLSRADFGMAAADGDYVLFAEGIDCATQSTSNITQVFNAAASTFGPTLQSRGTGINTVGLTVSSKAVFVGGGLNQYQPLIEIFSHTSRTGSFEQGADSDFAVISVGGEGFVAGGGAPRPTNQFDIVDV